MVHKRPGGGLPPFLNRLKQGGLVGLALVVVLGAVMFFSSYTVVDTGTRAVVKTFGEVTGVLDAGLHFRKPFITEIVRVDIKTQRVVANASAASKDLQIVTTEVVLNYRPNPDDVGTIVQGIGTDYQSKVVDPAIQESVKAATAQYTAEELITKRPLVSESIREVLRERLLPRGLIVEELSITEFKFSEEFARAIEAKQVADQDALRAERELRRVEIEAKQQVARAEAEAKARLVVAQSEAESLRLQREVISAELLQLRFIEKWNGVLPRMMSGDSGGLVPFINIPESELGDDEPPTAPATTPVPAPGLPTPTPTETAPGTGQ